MLLHEHCCLEVINTPLLRASLFKVASGASFWFFLSMSCLSLLLLIFLTLCWTSSSRTWLLALNAYPAARQMAEWKASTYFFQNSSACSIWAICLTPSAALYSTTWSKKSWRYQSVKVEVEEIFRLATSKIARSICVPRVPVVLVFNSLITSKIYFARYQPLLFFICFYPCLKIQA